MIICRNSSRWIGWLAGCFFVASGIALTLQELRRDEHLTPESFPAYFANFRYEYHEEVQEPEIFLATQKGDCDDYAILAAHILESKGYHPHLITVRMPGLVHVVCFVSEISGYLDYNNRALSRPIVYCNSATASIAQRVADSFGVAWTSVSEFHYNDGVKTVVSTAAQTDKYKRKS